MSLESQVGASLDRIIPTPQTIGRLLESAARHLADSRVAAISSEARFASAYTAIRILADIGLHAHGYRARTSRPGHHYVAIQALPQTFGVNAQSVVRLDYLRQLRNAIEYSGDIVPESAVEECRTRAEALYKTALQWLKRHKPNLMIDKK